MAREKVKTMEINMEIMLEIKNEFPKLMEFYNLAGIMMPVPIFYAVMRGENHKPELVQEVELGLNKARAVRDMSVSDMCRILGKLTAKQVEKAEAADLLRDVVARFM